MVIFRVDAKLDLQSILTLTSLDAEEVNKIFEVFDGYNEYKVTLTCRLDDDLVTILQVDDCIVIPSQTATIIDGKVVYDEQEY